MLKVIEAETLSEKEQARWVRRKVFTEGQKVPEQIEVDEFEESSFHFLALWDGNPVGAGRLRVKESYAKFERISTLEEFRGKGIGKEIMKKMQAFALSQLPQYLPMMHSQESAISFYEAIGWIPLGEAFIEAEILHKTLIFLSPSNELKNLKVLTDPNCPKETKDLIKKAIGP